MQKTGRNDLCPCGSGRKFKKCHEGKDKARSSRFLMIVVGGAIIAALVVAGIAFTGAPAGAGVRVWDPVHGHYHDANNREVP